MGVYGVDEEQISSTWDCWVWQEVSRDSADLPQVGPLSAASSTSLAPPGCVSDTLPSPSFLQNLCYIPLYLIAVPSHSLPGLSDAGAPSGPPIALGLQFTPSGACFLKGRQRPKSWVSGISSALPSLSLSAWSDNDNPPFILAAPLPVSSLSVTPHSPAPSYSLGVPFYHYRSLSGEWKVVEEWDWARVEKPGNQVFYVLRFKGFYLVTFKSLDFFPFGFYLLTLWIGNILSSRNVLCGF